VPSFAIISEFDIVLYYGKRLKKSI